MDKSVRIVDAAQNKRKEKARIAARARRSQEANIIMDMAQELLITQEKIRRIDKATIVRLAIDYIKAFEILCRFRSGRSEYIGNNARGASSISNSIINISINGSSSNSISDTSSSNSGSRSITGSDMSNCDNSNSRNSSSSYTSIRSNTTSTSVSQPPAYSAPKLSTNFIFAPKTEDMDSHFLLIADERDGSASFVLKPDTELVDEDDLTHLAPQAGDVSIPLEVEPLDGIVLDSADLFVSGSPPPKRTLFVPQEVSCCIGSVD